MYKNPIIFRQCGILLHSICLTEPVEKNIYLGSSGISYKREMVQHLQTESNGHRKCIQAKTGI